MSAAAMAMALACAGCGRDGSPVVATSSSIDATSTAASIGTTSENSPLAIADRFVAAWRAHDLATVRALSTSSGADQAAATNAPNAGATLVGRGCVASEQIPGTSLASASMICVYSRPFRGELRVGLDRSGAGWKVVGIELV